MENQHKLIKTYRDLTQTEIDLMNECKVLEAKYHELHKKIHSHVSAQAHTAEQSDNLVEHDRLRDSTPFRWLAVSKTDVEQGFMALVRAVAQPSTPKLEG